MTEKLDPKVGYETVSKSSLTKSAERAWSKMFMTHAIFAEAMRVMDWAYGWGEPDHGEGLVVADFEGWNPELAKFNGPPPRVGDVIRLSGSELSIVVKRATFDRGWKVEIGLDGEMTVRGDAGPMSEKLDPVFAIMDHRAIDDFDDATCMSAEKTLADAKREAPEYGDLCCVFKLVDGEEPEFIWQHGVDREAGRAILTGPTGLFDPEHLRLGGCGTIGGVALRVTGVNITGDTLTGSTAKVTAQRSDD